MIFHPHSKCQRMRCTHCCTPCSGASGSPSSSCFSSSSSSTEPSTECAGYARYFSFFEALKFCTGSEYGPTVLNHVSTLHGCFKTFSETDPKANDLFSQHFHRNLFVVLWWCTLYGVWAYCFEFIHLHLPQRNQVIRSIANAGSFERI